MTSKQNKRIYQLNVICEIKEEFMILWQELSNNSKKNKKHQQAITRLLTDIGTIKASQQNKLTKDLENE